MFPDIVANILELQRITVWEGAVTRLRMLQEGGHLRDRALGGVKLIIFYGERMPIDTLRALMDFFPNARFLNIYAASEAFWITGYNVPRPLPEVMESLPIGSPRKDYTVLLCDEDGTEVRPGELGEVCVVGPVGIIGYWKRPDLTEASRLNNIPNSYRTGDLARLQTDGNYHYGGRLDHQIKIRGHRFELGEIEAVLKSHRSVREAVAFVIDDQVRACVVAANRDDLAGELLSICARRLPAFATPASITVMGSFPQLPSGKVDRMALERLRP